MIQTANQLEILNNILQKHFSYFPPILKGSRKELVDSTLRLIADISLERFDKFIETPEMFKTHFPGCLEVARSRPKQKTLKILLQNLDDFPQKDQIAIYEILPTFPFPDQITKFLIKKHSRVPKPLEKDLLECLVKIGTEPGIQFCLDQVNSLDDDLHQHILEEIGRQEITFDLDTTREFIQRFERISNAKIQAGYLTLISRGHTEFGFPMLINCLSKQPEPVINAAIESLIRLERHEQITQNILDLYSSSRWYGLSMNIGIIHGIRYQSEQDSLDLTKGMQIISYLLNEDSNEAQLAAIEVAQYFSQDPRVIDWISSLLLSENYPPLLEKALFYLEDNPSESVKQALLKAFDRDIPILKLRVLEILASYEDQNLFDFYLEITKKEKSNSAFAATALLTASRAVPKGKEDAIASFLKSDSTELQFGAISAVLNCATPSLTSTLERNYTNYTGRNRSQAAQILFRLGVPYILDDLLAMLASEQAYDQKVAIEAIHEIYKFIQTTPIEKISNEVIALLEIHYRESEVKTIRESVLSLTEIPHILRIRELLLRGSAEEALQQLERIKNPESESFFLELAEVFISHQLGRDIEPEVCLKLTNEDPDCILPYQLLSNQLKVRKRTTEFLVNQLKLYEVVNQYNSEILKILGEFPMNEIGNTAYRKFMKIIVEGGLPVNTEAHQILYEVFWNRRQYHRSFRQLCYGFLTISRDEYLVDLVTSAGKCGYLDQASAICTTGLKLNLNQETTKKLTRLLEGIERLKESTR